MNIKSINGSVSINGRSFVGKSISITNGKISIDGKEVSEPFQEKEIHITISGDCGTIEGHTGDIKVVGDIVGDATTHAGNIYCKTINGSAQTSAGDINCDEIHGRATVSCGNIIRK